MAIHELYIGGPATGNFSRAMFPAAPFVPAAAAFQAVKVSAHKGPTSYGLTRVLDTSDHAMGEFLRNTTLAAADVLGVALIPKDVVLKGFFYEVVTAAGVAMVVTPAMRNATDGTLPTINCNVVGKGYAQLGDTAWQTASGAIAGGADFYIADPDMLNLTLTTFTSIGSLELVITPIVDTLYNGRP